MIIIDINLPSGIAVRSNSQAIKGGSTVPVEINFSSSPGTLALIEFALCTDSAPASTLAFLDEFEQQNECKYSGWLDANDMRLMAALAAVKDQAILCEVSWTIAGRKRKSLNLPLTVQAPLVIGPATSEGGPTYYTSNQVDGLVAGKMDAGDGLKTANNLADVENKALARNALGLSPMAIADPAAFMRVSPVELTANGATTLEVQGHATVLLTLEAASTISISRSAPGGAIVPGTVINILVLETAGHNLGLPVTHWMFSDPAPAAPSALTLYTLINYGENLWIGGWGA